MTMKLDAAVRIATALLLALASAVTLIGGLHDHVPIDIVGGAAGVLIALGVGVVLVLDLAIIRTLKAHVDNSNMHIDMLQEMLGRPAPASPTDGHKDEDA